VHQSNICSNKQFKGWIKLMNNSIWDENRLRIATQAAGVGLWSWNVDTDEITLDDLSCDLWGVPNTKSTTFETLSSRIHPEDLDRVRSAFDETRKLLVLYEIDFRILSGDQARWISARGQGDDDGIVGRILFGVFLDVSMRKEAEIARDIISQEMDHRIKNLFAITSALTRFSMRATNSKEEMAADLLDRIQSLSQAHSLIRSNLNRKHNSTGLKELLTVLLSPYADKNSSANNLLVSAPDIDVCESAATALALITHELATNSIKYGALSVADGSLTVACEDADGDVIINWTERGGPPVVSPNERKGFGSVLLSGSVAGQLDGEMDVDWQPEGIVVTIRVKKTRLED
jgi:two-component sensor histidine kinase